LITSNESTQIAILKLALQAKFEMTNIGLATNYLGTEIQQHELGIFIHQRNYIQCMLQHYGFQNCNSTKLSMDPKLQLTKETNTPSINLEQYISMVGSLLFATQIHLDISYVVIIVSRYLEQPQQAHLEAVKHILQYLQGTLNYGLFLP